MARDVLNISIDDEDHNPHEYAIRKHGAIEAALLFARLVPAISGTITSAAPFLIQATQKQAARRQASEGEEQEAPASRPDESGEAGQLESLEALLGGMPGALLSIAQLADEDLIRELFKHTFRDGKRLSGGHEFDKAYQDNLAEMLIALGRIIRHNFEKSIRRLLGKYLGAAADKVAEMLPPDVKGWQKRHAH